jgi:hypothetical protein
MHTENLTENVTHTETKEQGFFSQIFFPHPHMPGVRADVLGEVSHWPISNTTTFLILTLFIFICIVLLF